jgi:formylglycine-generating enzyme required for sulfatase activity
MQAVPMQTFVLIVVALLALYSPSQASEAKLALSLPPAASSGLARGGSSYVIPAAGRPLAKAVYDAANDIFIGFQKKCGGALPGTIAFVGLPEHEPRVSDAVRRRLNAELLRSAGGGLVQPTEMSSLKLLAPFLAQDAKGQEEMKKAEDRITGSPLAVITEIRRPAMDALELSLSFLDKRPGCADGTRRTFYVQPSTLEVAEERLPDEADGEIYDLRGFYYKALAEFARPLAAAAMTRSALHFDFSGNCDLRREALPIFESSYQRLRQETGNILSGTPVMPPLSDGDFAQTRDASVSDNNALIRLRFAGSSISRRHVSSTIEFVYKGAKQYVFHATVAADERALTGCSPAEGSAQPSGGAAGPAREAQKDCAACPEVLVLSAGEFTMGSPDTEPGRSEDEGPAGIRRIKNVAISRYEVTVNEFEAFLSESGHTPAAMSKRAISQCSAPNADDKWVRSGAKTHRQPGFPQTADDPVICVSWYDAKAYAQWLAAKTGKPYRLLSEAESEYMGRAGTTSPFWWGESIDPKLANYEVATGVTSIGPASTVPKGALPANPWGFYHVSGNAAEWVEDCWNERHSPTAQSGEPRLSGDCTNRVIRGGGWTYAPNTVRSASRDHARSEETFVDVGFRVAKDLGPN